MTEYAVWSTTSDLESQHLQSAQFRLQRSIPEAAMLMKCKVPEPLNSLLRRPPRSYSQSYEFENGCITILTTALAQIRSMPVAPINYNSTRRGLPTKVPILVPEPSATLRSLGYPLLMLSHALLPLGAESYQRLSYDLLLADGKLVSSLIKSVGCISSRTLYLRIR